MTIYFSRRPAADGGGIPVFVRSPGGSERALNPRTNVICHSPDGFQWGYHGSGPAQLALAILLDATRDEALATRLYGEFKGEVIATADPSKRLKISQAEVLQWIQGKENTSCAR